MVNLCLLWGCCFCCTHRMAELQKPATIIKMGADDPLYLSFLPALEPAMIAAWHQPKVMTFSCPVDLLYFVL